MLTGTIAATSTLAAAGHGAACLAGSHRPWNMTRLSGTIGKQDNGHNRNGKQGATTSRELHATTAITAKVHCLLLVIALFGMVEGLRLSV